MTSDDEDQVKRRIQQDAAACLDFMRQVRWGSGTARYQMDDGDRKILVDITITTIAQSAAKQS